MTNNQLEKDKWIILQFKNNNSQRMIPLIDLLELLAWP